MKIKWDWVTLRIPGLFDDFVHQGESNPPGLSKWFILLTVIITAILKMRKQGERPGTTLWNSSSGWGLRACSCRSHDHEPFASLLICQRFSLLHFPIRTKTIFDDIQAYSVLDFPSTKLPLNSQRRTRESEICNVSTILEVSGKLNLLMNLNRSHW